MVEGKTTKPLLEQNVSCPISPRSHWVAKVSQLKLQQSQLKQQEELDVKSLRMSWNEVEANLNKKTRSPTPVQEDSCARDATQKLQSDSFKKKCPKAQSDDSMMRGAILKGQSHVSKAVAKCERTQFGLTQKLPQSSKHRKEKKTPETSTIQGEGHDENVCKPKTITSIQHDPSSRQSTSNIERESITKETAPKAQEHSSATSETEQKGNRLRRKLAKTPKPTKGENISEPITDSPSMEKHDEINPQPGSSLSVTKKRTIISFVGRSETQSVTSSSYAREAEAAKPELVVGELNTVATVRAQKKSKNTVKRSKGTLLWLRRALIAKDPIRSASLHTSSSMTTNEKPPPQTPLETKKSYSPTTPLQQLLWLSTAKRAIAEAQAPPSTLSPSLPQLPSISPRSPRSPVSPTSPIEAETVAVTEVESVSNYYHHTQDTGVYVDYSTFDDGDSVSSLEFLFKWLTCRELDEGRKPQCKPPGTVIATESIVSDDELSLDMEIKPRRRTLFSR